MFTFIRNLPNISPFSVLPSMTEHASCTMSVPASAVVRLFFVFAILVDVTYYICEDLVCTYWQKPVLFHEIICLLEHCYKLHVCIPMKFLC